MLFFLLSNPLGRVVSAQQVDTSAHPASLSERLVEWILDLLEPESKKIDENLVRDHI